MSTTKLAPSSEPDYEFREVDGLIVSIPAAQARREREELLRINPGLLPWELELALNSEHLQPQWTRADLREAVRAAGELAEALRNAYPERTFVIRNRLGSATHYFCQSTPDVPTRDTEPEEPRPEASYCPSCCRRERFHPHPAPDREFPELEWAACAACGSELFLWCRDRFTLVLPVAP